jgi:hypothetical protein
VAHGGGGEAVARQPVSAPECQRQPGERHGRARRQRNRCRDERRERREQGVRGHRGRGEDPELARGQPERETVLELDVGGKPDPLAHASARHTFATT